MTSSALERFRRSWFWGVTTRYMQESLEGNPAVATLKNVSRGFAALTVPLTASFPKALFCYWITSNLFSLLYGLSNNNETLSGVGELHNLYSTYLISGTGIAELIALEISNQDKSCLDLLQRFNKPWTHDHEPINDFLDAVK
ncbi:hypothetical protein Lser_V15G37811 [Lactuca serriola]